MNKSYFNPFPFDPFKTIDDLRFHLNQKNPNGDKYLNYLLQGDYLDGKDLWVNNDENVKKNYNNIINNNPHLITESPYNKYIKENSKKIKNIVILSNIIDANENYKNIIKKYNTDVSAGVKKKNAVFCGGPATKIAAIITSLKKSQNLNTIFLLDGAEQSNESSSASYEHINHANALNAEYDNTAIGILPNIIKRMIFKEPEPNSALCPEYKKVDLWLKSLRLKDFVIYTQNTLHGWIQFFKKTIHIPTEHDKSRSASKVSSKILNYIETMTGIKLKLPSETARALIIHYNKNEHQHSIKENIYLFNTLKLKQKKLSQTEIEQFYSITTCKQVTSVDIFYDNNCIVHGFDNVVGNILNSLGSTYQKRVKVKEIFFDYNHPHPRAVAVLVKDMLSGTSNFIPVDFLGLSLGSKVNYTFRKKYINASLYKKNLSKYVLPVPYQTIATGFSGQILFEIIDKDKFDTLPHSGLKQTHFVEIGRSDTHLLVKLTAGGNIASYKYSRSYAINALANMLRVLTPDCGIQYVDTVCAWPCSRGINGSNNGVAVQLGDNFVVRYGEGGTGMSRMGSNAQVILDLIGISHELPEHSTLPFEDYSHTIIDKRKYVSHFLFN